MSAVSVCKQHIIPRADMEADGVASSGKSPSLCATPQSNSPGIGHDEETHDDAAAVAVTPVHASNPFVVPHSNYHSESRQSFTTPVGAAAVELGHATSDDASVMAGIAPASASELSEDDELSRLLQGVRLEGATVALVYEPSMQAHAPAWDGSAHELPQRIVAIESVLRGYAFDKTRAATPPVQSTTTKTRDWGESSPLKTGLRETTVTTRAYKLSLQPLVELFDADKGVDRLALGLETGWKATEQHDALPGSLWSRCAIIRAPLAPLEWLQVRVGCWVT